MQLHADAGVCHFENANLEQTVTYFGEAVFLDISHAVPSYIAVARNVPKLRRMLGHSLHILASTNITQILTARRKEFRDFLTIKY